MPLDFYIGLAADTRSILEETFSQPNGTVINLTGYTVTAKFVHQATGTVLSKSASNTPGTSGVVQITFAANDLADADGNALPGGWDYQFKAVSGSVTVHVPNDGYKVLWALANVEDEDGTHPYYPTAADFWRFIEAHGLTVGDSLKPLLRPAVQAGVRSFERQVGRRMLAGAEETKYYDPPTQYADGGATLFIDDLAAFALTTPVVYQPLNSLAETLTAATDYWAEPRNALTQAVPEPVTRIKFRRRWSAPLSGVYRGALRVTGRFGYAVSIPEDCWSAMLSAAAGWLWTSMTTSLTGGRLSYKDDDVAEDFGIEPSKAQQAAWSAQVAQTASAYRRFSL